MSSDDWRFLIGLSLGMTCLRLFVLCTALWMDTGQERWGRAGLVLGALATVLIGAVMPW